MIEIKPTGSHAGMELGMTDETISITGGCLCGAIRYKATKAPHYVGYCHCTMCQKVLGNLFGAYACFRTLHFQYLADEPKWYIHGDRIKRGHCGICGSPIAHQKPNTDWLAIWIGSLDDRETYQPQAHANCDSRISWVDIQPYLPYRYESGELQPEEDRHA